jgi:hypothetical protein
LGGAIAYSWLKKSLLGKSQRLEWGLSDLEEAVLVGTDLSRPSRSPTSRVSRRDDRSNRTSIHLPLPVFLSSCSISEAHQTTRFRPRRTRSDRERKNRKTRRQEALKRDLRILEWGDTTRSAWSGDAALKALDARAKLRGDRGMSANDVDEWKEGVGRLRATTYAELLKPAADKGHSKTWVEAFFPSATSASDEEDAPPPSPPPAPPA